MSNLLTDIEFRRVMNRDAGTPATYKATIVDMAGFDEVTFVVAFQTVVNGAAVTFRIAQAATNVTGDMVVSKATTGAITSDGTTIALSNKQLILTVTKPMHRYLEAQVVIATQNAPIDHITAILSSPRDRATVQGSTVYSSAIHASPTAA